MSIELKDIELVDRYLSGNLDGASLQAFQSRLQSDTTLQELLSDFQSTNELVKANEYAQLQAQLDSFSYDASPWWQSNVTKIAGVIGVAAVITTAVWMTSSDKPAAPKENSVVAQSSSPKDRNASQVTSADKTSAAASVEKSSQSKSSDKKDDLSWFKPNIDDALAPDVIVVFPEENSAPLTTPVPTPTGPAAVPPQQDSVVSSSKAPLITKTDGVVPNANNTPKEEEQPVINKFYIQVPGGNWAYPEYMKNGNLHIVNESGALINDISLNASTDSWNATDRYGSLVPAGLYFYQYTDAATGKVYAGSVTVVY